MAAHLREVLTWIVGQINGDSTLTTTLGLKKAWMFSAPEHTAFPYVIMTKQTGAHDHSLGNREAHNRHYVAIKCVDNGFDGGDRARKVMDRVKDLINHQRPTLTQGGYTIAILASNDYEYDEQENGNQNFYHVVTVYMIQLGD